MVEAACALCGEAAGRPVAVRFNGRQRTFCTFLCAIRAMAPVCAGCGAIVLGKGQVQDGVHTCSARCAAQPAAT